MPTYNVTITLKTVLAVNADDKQEAIELAEEMVFDGDGELEVKESVAEEMPDVEGPQD